MTVAAALVFTCMSGAAGCGKKTTEDIEEKKEVVQPEEVLSWYEDDGIYRIRDLKKTYRYGIGGVGLTAEIHGNADGTLDMNPESSGKGSLDGDTSEEGSSDVQQASIEGSTEWSSTAGGGIQAREAAEVTENVSGMPVDTVSGGAIDIEETKKKAYINDISDIAPIYNVDINQAFKIKFAASSVPEDAIEVYTTKECLPDSKVKTKVWTAGTDDGGTELTLKPEELALVGIDRLSSMKSSDLKRWGYAPSYYIRIKYSPNATIITELDRPAVIRFTVASLLETPTLTGEINGKGNVKLRWSESEGADGYRIYKVSSEGMDGKSYSEVGYRECYPRLVAEVGKDVLQWNDWIGDSTNGLVKSKSGYVSTQNFGFDGEYFVTAIKRISSTDGNPEDAIDEIKKAEDKPEGSEADSIDDKTGTDKKKAVKEKASETKTAEKKSTKQKKDDKDAAGTSSDNHGTVTGASNDKESESVTEEKQYIIESNFSESVNSLGFLKYAPLKLSESSQLNGEIQGIANLPKVVDVLNINGSTTKHQVNYKLKEKYQYNKNVYYEYSIVGTRLTGEVGLTAKTGDKVSDTIINGTDTDADVLYVQYEIGDAPTPKIESYEKNKDLFSEAGIAETLGVYAAQALKEAGTETSIIKETALDNETATDSAVEENVDSTDASEQTFISLTDYITEMKDEIKSADGVTVEQLTGNGMEVNVSDEYEAYLATKLINGSEEIDLTAFPRMQDGKVLRETLNHVIEQNPYILGVKKISYSYETKKASVEYRYNKENIEKRQSEMQKQVAKIQKKLTAKNWNLHDTEKVEKIYSWLEKNAVYDEKAAAKVSGKEKRDKALDGFSAYGVLLKGKGNSQGYAKAMQLLCMVSGIPCETVSGYFNSSVKHYWNVVGLDGLWAHTDTINNKTNSGVKGLLLNAPYVTATELGYVMDDRCSMSNDVEEYREGTTLYDWFITNNMTAMNEKQYGLIVKREVAKKTNPICIRYTGKEIGGSRLAELTAKAYKKAKKEKQLKNTALIQYGNYIILNTK